MISHRCAMRCSQSSPGFGAIVQNLRRRRTLSAPPVSSLGGHLTAFRQAAADFAGFMDGAVAAEPETAAIVERLAEMATALANGPDPAKDQPVIGRQQLVEDRREGQPARPSARVRRPLALAPTVGDQAIGGAGRARGRLRLRRIGFRHAIRRS